MVESNEAQIKKAIADYNTKNMHRERLTWCKEEYEKHIGTNQEAKYGEYWVSQYRFAKSNYEGCGYDLEEITDVKPPAELMDKFWGLCCLLGQLSLRED